MNGSAIDGSPLLVKSADRNAGDRAAMKLARGFGPVRYSPYGAGAAAPMMGNPMMARPSLTLFFPLLWHQKMVLPLVFVRQMS